jgi:hypothetical protein
MTRTFRTVAGTASTAESLGPLKDLPGFWQGEGFSLIGRPDFNPENTDGVFLELNLLRETIEFTTIGSPVMNRGSVQEDVSLFGVTYLHRVTDASNGGALHVEPGVWLRVPATSDPDAPESVARLATVPHGNSFCATGEPVSVVPEGPIEIPPENTVPFPIGGQAPPPGTPNPYAVYDLATPSPFRTEPLPPEITQAIVDDPIVLLRAALERKQINHVVRLMTSTASAADIGNIPFITRNADAVQVDAVFAIERLEKPDGGEYLQLQYAQTVLLNFRGMSFPHVTVGTLVKAF